jgi:hypothetical protein
MHLKLIGSTLLAIWLWLKLWWDRLSPIIIPIVKDVEQKAQDGTIDLADRKKIAMNAIALLQQEGKIKLNYVEWLIVGKLVDWAAERLPDFQLTKDIKTAVTQVSK